ncbi:hypothetical protein L873DRAFT_1793794 [Choiromyces venosus 120613-1]|uniref:Protein kinase domain-containing protein n=1 Tax=Choiromyces venosus 120613-1 TaxID=1336337 RepID=A0A3N4J4A8_9PEZI|nr:hypothetical protein L873DRAFT_1793794 [Choiromyces venosus 120613-1]
MTTKPRLEPIVPSNLPVLISSDLGITSWTPLDHGGHSFVLKITTSPSSSTSATTSTTSTSVLKIFRFHRTLPNDTSTTSTDPYHYYSLESSAYSRLKHSHLTGTTVPEIYGVVHIAPEHEHHLAINQGIKALAGMRRHFPELTVVGLWMEHVDGARLLPKDAVTRWAEGLRAGLARIHAAGVVQRDIKWRNLVVGEGGGGRGLVWVDFSNAGIRGEGEGDGEWKERVEMERGMVEEMLTRASRKVRGAIEN